MIRKQTYTISIFTLSACILLSGCGVSDYINSRKIQKAPAYKEEAVETKKVSTSKCDANELRATRIVKYINRVRANKQLCGDKPYKAAPAISWNAKLFNAAKAHSFDMADNNLFSHAGSNNSSTGSRVSDVGYDWKAVAENISGGTDTPEQTIDRWMTSPGHCHNIMNPTYKEIGLACVINDSSEYQIYWTLVLATKSK